MATLIMVIWMTLLVVHTLLFLCALAHPLKRRKISSERSQELPPVSIIVPVRGARGDLDECLSSLAHIEYPGAELIICVGDERDAALPVARSIAASAGVPTRCVVGRADGYKNDKLRLVASGYDSSIYSLILMTDDNVIWRADLLRDLALRISGRVGLVSAVTVATRANNLWGRLEQAMINGYFNKLLLIGDVLGITHVTGKVLMFRRTDLEAAGGIRALNDGVCEDAALREKLEARGLHAVLSPLAAEHPVSDRSCREFWHRHMRWLRCRRAHGGLVFWLEPLTGVFAFLVWSVTWGALDPEIPSWLPAVAGTALWIVLEVGYLAARRLPFALSHVFAILIREALFPALWWQCLTRATVDWRGNSFSMVTGRTKTNSGGS